MTRMTKAKLREWLTGYAWFAAGDHERIECIVANTRITDLEALQEHYRGMVESPGDPEQIFEAEEFALSALYETHGPDGGKHSRSCPYYGYRRE